MSKNTVTAILVVRHEQRLIKRCLDSLKKIVDEIIIIHDGRCKDNTLKIAKQVIQPSKLRIYERCPWYSSEPHRLFGLHQARTKWVMEIDADEKLSDKTQKDFKKILDKADKQGYNQILFAWKYTDWKGHQTDAVTNEVKVVLHKRLFTYHDGITHNPYWTIGKSQTLPQYCVEHLTTPSGFNKAYLKRKIFERSTSHAKSLVQNKRGNRNKYVTLILGMMFAFAEPLYQAIAHKIIFKPDKYGLLLLGILYQILVHWKEFQIRTGKLDSGWHKPNTCGFKYCSQA